MATTEADDLEAEQTITNYVRIVHEMRADIRSLNEQLILSRENELFRVKESNQLAHENAELRKENARVTNNCEAFRLLLIDVEASFATLFPRLTGIVQKAKRETAFSERPPIRRVAS